MAKKEMLRIVIGYGNTYESATQAAIDLYNAIGGKKTVICIQDHSNLVTQNTTYRTEIWFAIEVDE